MGKDFKDGCCLDAFNPPFGGFLFDGWLSKDRRVFWDRCERFLYVRQYSSTADVARPSALREAWI